MSRFISDQNKVVFKYESGTYGSASGNGYWVGEVTEHSIDDQENLLEDRFLGTSTRSVSEWVGGPRDVTGTLTYHPQDMKIPFFAIGSNYEFNGTGSNKVHYATQVSTNVWQNPFCSGTSQLNGPISFTLEDSKNAAGDTLIRTINGCVANSVTITAAQSEKVTIDIDYIGKTLTFTSGTATSVTPRTVTPYLWSNCSLTLAGSTVNTAKEVTLTINQNIDAPHYLNNSRDIGTPILGNRENTLSVTMDLDTSTGRALYELYKNNGTFNGTFDLNADVASTGSMHTIFFLSGCKVSSMENPSIVEGTTESSVEIVCPILIGSAIDTNSYNPF